MSEGFRSIIAYVSGPMTGREDNNRHAFNAASESLRESGIIVLSPAEHDMGKVHERSHHMRFDIQQVLMSDVVYVLPGWKSSKGAKLEVAIAREIGLPIIDYVTETEI
jgi:hypothetical protein